MRQVIRLPSAVARSWLGEVGMGVITTGNSIPAEPATEPDPSRGSGAGAAAETVAADWEPPCVAREGGSSAADTGSLSVAEAEAIEADELAARGIESPETTQNHLDAVNQAQAGGASTSPTNDGADGAGAVACHHRSPRRTPPSTSPPTPSHPPPKLTHRNQRPGPSYTKPGTPPLVQAAGRAAKV